MFFLPGIRTWCDQNICCCNCSSGRQLPAPGTWESGQPASWSCLQYFSYSCGTVAL